MLDFMKFFPSGFLVTSERANSGRLRCLQRYPLVIFPLNTDGQPETGHESVSGLRLRWVSGKASKRMEEGLGICGIIS